MALKQTIRLMQEINGLIAASVDQAESFGKSLIKNSLKSLIIFAN